jgi:hypothetical protein
LTFLPLRIKKDKFLPNSKKIIQDKKGVLMGRSSMVHENNNKAGLQNKKVMGLFYFKILSDSPLYGD